MRSCPERLLLADGAPRCAQDRAPGLCVVVAGAQQLPLPHHDRRHPHRRYVKGKAEGDGGPAKQVSVATSPRSPTPRAALPGPLALPARRPTRVASLTVCPAPCACLVWNRQGRGLCARQGATASNGAGRGHTERRNAVGAGQAVQGVRARPAHPPLRHRSRHHLLPHQGRLRQPRSLPAAVRRTRLCAGGCNSADIDQEGWDVVHRELLDLVAGGQADPASICVVLHGDRSNAERLANLERFRAGLSWFLICTDVAARGIDIKGLPYVISAFRSQEHRTGRCHPVSHQRSLVCRVIPDFTLPDEAASYVHRIGRVGRAGIVGLAISLVASVPEKVILEQTRPHPDIDTPPSTRPHRHAPIPTRPHRHAPSCVSWMSDRCSYRENFVRRCGTMSATRRRAPTPS